MLGMAVKIQELLGRAGIKEKKVVLDISNRLKKILQNRGLTVKMTRERDEFISLQKRTEIASRSNADLFVSVHANSSPVRGVNGIEVFSAKNLKIMDKDAAVRRKNKQLLFRNLSMKNGASNVEKIVLDMLYTNKQAEAKIFGSEAFQGNIKSNKDKKSRGQRISLLCFTQYDDPGHTRRGWVFDES